MLRYEGGGGSRREEPAGTGILMELLRSLGEGACYRLSVVGRGEGGMPPKPYAVPGAADARGCSSVTTPA